MNVDRFLLPVLRTVAKNDRASTMLDRLLYPWNPFTPGRYENPYPLYEQLRGEIGAMGYQRSLQGWNVVGYEAVEEVMRNPNMSVDRSELLSEVTPYRKLESGSRSLFLSSMLLRDPPDHTRLRTLVNRAFTPRKMAARELHIEKIARGLLEQMKAEDRADAMEAFCSQLPIHVISDMLGLPEQDWAEFSKLSDELVQFIDPISSFEPSAMDQTVRRFSAKIGALISEREQDPQDDMLTQLVQASDDGDRLDRSEVESMVSLLMVAGHETTASLLGNSLLALQQNPDAKDQLRTEPEIAANAVEELLRFDSPVQATDRYPTADVVIDGNEVKQGQLIGIHFGAANRDPERYDRPNELILDRPDPRPLSFGHGIHHCLGAALARIEARIALPLFLQTFPDYRIDEDRMTWKRSVTIRGPKQLPMTL